MSSVAAVPLEAEGAVHQPGSLSFLAARVVLGAVLLAAPLALGAVQTWSWAALVALSILLLFLWASGCVRQQTVKIVWSPLYLPAALFLLLGLVQLFAHLTRDRIATREALLKLVADLIFFFLTAQLFAGSSRRTWRSVGLGVLVYAFLFSLLAMVQFFSSPNLIYWSVKPHWGGWIFGPYVNHNHYAGLMELLIPLGAAYAFSRRQNPGRALVGFAVLVPVASLLLSGSRGGVVALLAESLLCIVVLSGVAAAPSRRTLALAVTLGMTTAVLLFLWMDPGDISKRLGGIFNPSHFREKSLGERKVVALDSLRIFLDHPWAGTGLGSFETVYPRYQSLPGDAVWDHAHNDYAEALAETGLAGALLILLSLALFFRLAFNDLRRRLGHEAGWVQAGAALGCCGLLVHSMVDFNLHIPANAAWFAACAAWATCGGIELHPSENRRN